MGEITGPLTYLLLTWGGVTVLLVIMVIYRATLASREDDQIFLNKAEDNMMASEQRELIGKLDRLSRPIITLATLSGVLLVASAGLWLWNGLTNF
jgi:hypothetical protein